MRRRPGWGEPHRTDWLWDVLIYVVGTIAHLKEKTR